MTPARLEHLNVTVADPRETAAWMTRVFGWRIRWEGPGMETGYTVHVGSEDSYLALFTYGESAEPSQSSYQTKAGLNHVAIVVDDLDTTEKRIKEEGFQPGTHHDYEPGRRFYFEDGNGIEFEIVCYD